MGDAVDTFGRAKNSERRGLGSSIAYTRRFEPRRGRGLSFRLLTKVVRLCGSPSWGKTNPTPRLKTGADSCLQETMS
jgi:hypothetical protein